MKSEFELIIRYVCTDNKKQNARTHTQPFLPKFKPYFQQALHHIFRCIKSREYKIIKNKSHTHTNTHSYKYTHTYIHTNTPSHIHTPTFKSHLLQHRTARLSTHRSIINY